MGAKPGNKNAKVEGQHPSMIVRLKTPTIDLLMEYFALEGNAQPSRGEIQDAIDYAIRQAYGRKIEDQGAIIV